MVIDHVLVMSSTWMLIFVSCPPLQATFPTQLTLSAPSERGVYTDSKIESGWSVTSGGASLGNEKMDRSKNANFPWEYIFTHICAHIHTFFICISKSHVPFHCGRVPRKRTKGKQIGLPFSTCNTAIQRRKSNHMPMGQKMWQQRWNKIYCHP